MVAPSLDIEVLTATLASAEAQVRALVAEALPASAAFRVEQRSTEAARAAWASVQVSRRLELPTGWAEHVDVSAEIEALLERLVVPEAPVEVTAAVAPVPVVPELPPEIAAVSAPAPAEPVAAAARAPEAPSVAARIAEPPAPAPAPAHDPWAAQHDPWGSGGDPWGQQGGWGGDAWEQPAEPAPAEPQPAATSEPADHGFSQTDWTTGHGADDYGRVDPYAATEQRTGRVLSLDELDEDAAPARPAPPAPGPPRAAVAVSAPTVVPSEPGPAPLDEDLIDDELLDEAIERTHAELTLDLPNALRDDDGPTDVAIPAPPRLSRPAAAAVQLHAGGGGTIVGAEDEDDDASMASAIALDEASESSESVADLPSSALGLMAFDDDAPGDDDEGETTGFILPVLGAPRLSDDALADLLANARATARRDLQEAALLYGDVLDADPSHLEALVQRGRIYLELHDFARAISDLLKAEEHAPDDASVHAALGELWFVRKDYRRAVAALDVALKAQGKQPAVLYRRGMSRMYLRDFAAAVEDLEAAKRLDPSLPSIDTYLDRARRKQV